MDRAIIDTRGLSPEDVATYEAEGRALTTEQAVALALSTPLPTSVAEASS